MPLERSTRVGGRRRCIPALVSRLGNSQAKGQRGKGHVVIVFVLPYGVCPMSVNLKRTPLFEAHQVAGARLVDFGGWEMPLHYGSQIQEHHAVRQHAGVFDVSHMLGVDVTGVQAREFLRFLLANDVNRLTVPGRALYSCMLNPRGGVVDDLLAYFLNEGNWRLVVNAGCADKDLAWMQRVADKTGLQVEIVARRDLAMLAVQGPEAAAKLAEIRPDWGDALQSLKPFTAVEIGQTLLSRTGYTGEDGFEVALPASEVVGLWTDLLAAGVAPCGLGARDTLRLEAGMALYGQDMDELTLPAEAGLQWTVNLKDETRDFLGKSALLGFEPKRQMLGLRLLERGVMRSHMVVQTEHGDGVITSGTMSPTMGVSIAMASLPRQVKVDDQVRVLIRDKAVAAQVCPLPFVRHGQIVKH